MSTDEWFGLVPVPASAEAIAGTIAAPIEIANGAMSSVAPVMMRLNAVVVLAVSRAVLMYLWSFAELRVGRATFR